MTQPITTTNNAASANQPDRESRTNSTELDLFLAIIGSSTRSSPEAGSKTVSFTSLEPHLGTGQSPNRSYSRSLPQTPSANLSNIEKIIELLSGKPTPEVIKECINSLQEEIGDDSEFLEIVKDYNENKNLTIFIEKLEEFAKL